VNILSIDPGPEKSAWIIFKDGVPKVWAWDKNEDIIGTLFYNNRMSPTPYATHLAVEYVYLRGMKVFQQAIDTVFWAGRFVEAWGGDYTLIDRRDEKRIICGNQKADNTSIKYSIIDSYFGGKAKAIGGVKCKTCKGKGWRGRDHAACTDCHHKASIFPEPGIGCGYEVHEGPLHGISGKGSEHIWSALAVGLTYIEMEKEARAVSTRSKSIDTGTE